MKLLGVSCYVVLAITVTATHIQASSIESQDTQDMEELESDENNKIISKRETAVLIDNYPFEARHKQPSVIYMRRTRYPYSNKLKSKYAWRKPKHPSNKRGKRVPYKRFPPKSPKKHYPPYPSPRYTIHKSKHVDFKKKKPQTFYEQEPVFHAAEPTGFGEPPVQYEHVPKPYTDPYIDPHEDINIPLKPFSEPLVDSYGFPVKYPTGEEGFGYDHEPQDGRNSYFNGNDHLYAFSKKRPSYEYIANQNEGRPSLHMHDPPIDYNDDFALKTYSDVYNFGHKTKRYQDEPKNPDEHHSVKPSKYKRVKAKREPKDQVIVGGQYAEPPGRYVPKFPPSPPMIAEDGDNFAPPRSFDSDTSGSSSISSYVNYKNSNMAFSPQNLNDAFSIKD